MRPADVEVRTECVCFYCFHKVTNNALLTSDMSFDANVLAETGSIIGGYGWGRRKKKRLTIKGEEKDNREAIGSSGTE